MKADNEKYINKIKNLNIQIEEDSKQNQQLRNNQKTLLQDLVLLKNDFSSKYNETINDLTLIINHLELTNKINSEINNNEDPDEDNPAAISAIPKRILACLPKTPSTVT